uniref:Rho-GAP domain-containing protein n=1 Tax=Arcella intermedia TaxID=1963864 RepID=A0A6B2LED8_9EUKA
MVTPREEVVLSSPLVADPSITKKTEKRRKKRIGSTVLKKGKQGMYFGVPLEESFKTVAAMGELHFTEICMNFIAAHGIEAEGLFRISGNGSNIQEWASLIDSGGLLVFDQKASIHDATGILKKYFQELPERLIPLKYMRAFCATDTDELILKRIYVMLDELPEPNKIVLKNLLQLLHKVSANSETNKMNIKNLSTCWSPTVFPEPELPSSSINDKVAMTLLLETTALLNKVLVIMISHTEEICRRIHC